MPENAQTKDGIRYYTWEGKEYPSVTSLRRLLGMPFGLANWMVGQALDAAISMADDIPALVIADGPDETRKNLRRMADTKRDEAADLGTRVHEAAEQGRSPDVVEEDVAPFLRQYYDFVASTGAKVLAQEGQVFNLTLGYAGSFDLIADVKDGDVTRRVCIDIKTGKDIYADHALQLMGYSLGEFVGRNDIVSPDATALLHSCTDMAVLHIRPEGWELVYLDVTPRLRQAFERMCGLAHWFKAHQRIDSLIKEVVTK